MTAPIVILHGWGLSANTFAPLAAELRKNHMIVFVPDFPGFDSRHIPTNPMTLSDYVDFLDEYMHKHNIKKPILIGHSFGGRVALKYQNNFPKKVAALVLTGTPGFTPISKNKLTVFIMIAKVGGALMSLPVLNMIKDRVRLWYYYAVGARDFYRAEGVMRETFKNIVKEPLVECMENIRVATLLVWGEHDVIVPPAVAYQMEKVIPRARLILIAKIGHDVPFKSPKIFVASVLPWLESL
jgi:pimeloyl-ACP methyl ester carboxylesterase